MKSELIKLIQEDLKNGEINLLQKNIHILTVDEKTTLLPLVLNNKQVLLFLIENGAEVNKAENQENNLLVMALRSSKLNPQHDVICHIIIDAGIDVTMFESIVMFVAAVQNKFDIFKRIVEMGADIHAKNNEVVLSVASCGNIEMLNYILEAGVPVDKNGCDIRIAINNGHLDMAKTLVDKGALINCKNEEGMDAIMCAAKFEYLDMVQYLLEYGANIEGVFQYFKSPEKSPYDIFHMHKKGSKNPIVKDWCLEYLKRKKLKNSLEQSLPALQIKKYIYKI